MSNPVIWSYWNHEPIYHLKRMGNDGGSVFSLGEWVDEWYDRIHQEELLIKAEEMGINTVYTHYYKGSGIQFEYEEMERTRAFTELAHKHGIKVLGYISMGSIYTENITREIPDVADMLVYDFNGKTIPTLGNQYYRPRPCYNSAKYLAHMKNVIRYGIEHVGLDGFHFDNSHIRFCHCETCQEKFRQYLRDNFKNPYEVMGIKHFDHVRIPVRDILQEGEVHDSVPAGNNHDVLFSWYYKFQRATLAAFHKACFDYVKEVSGGKALVLHNPGFPRSGRVFKACGYDPELSPASCDYVFVENSGAAFGTEGGRIEGEIMAYKYGERFGYKVFDTSWLDSAGGAKAYRFPRDKQEIARFTLQGAIFGGIVGEPWTVRSMKNGADVFIDVQYAYDGLKESFHFFRDNYAIFDSTSYNRVKLLHHPDSMYNAVDGRAEMDAIVKTLVENNIPFSIISEADIPSLEKGDTLILAAVTYCSADLYEKIKTVCARGVMALATQGFGHYNENTKGRAVRNAIYDLQGVENKKILSVQDLAASIAKNVTVNVPDVVLETRITADGRLALHALNANNHRDIPEMEIVFEDEKLAGCSKWEVFTPDDTQVTVELSGSKAIVKIQNYQTLVSVLFS